MTTRRQFIAAFGAAPLVLRTPSQEPARTQEDTRRLPPLSATLILVRHAEKADDDARDPGLSKTGIERAEAFSSMLGSAGVTGLVHSEYRRTRDTLAPLSKLLELKSETIRARDMPALIERISGAKADETIVVSGHSNTVPAIAWAFGVLLPDLEAPEMGPKLPYGYLPHDAYDRVHVLTPGRKDVRLLELRT